MSDISAGAAAPGQAAGVRLSHLVRDLGPLVRDVVAGSGDPDPLIRFAEIVDDALTVVEPSTVLLDVGDRFSEDAPRFSALASPVIVLKHDAELRRRVLASAGLEHTHLVTIEPLASWFHVAGLVRDRLGLGTFAGTAGVDSESFGTDLFEVANAVSELVAGPVTIEDRDFTVIAFSQRNQSADPARAETVLGRAVPGKYRQILDDAQVRERLAEADSPLYLELGGDLRPRLVMPVCFGGEVLGSMWAVVDGPVGVDRATAFGDAARIVALALLRRRAEARGGRRLRAGLLADVLLRSPDAAEARTRLGLADREARLLGIDLSSLDEVGRLRVADAVALQIAAVSSASAVTILDDRLYAVVPTDHAAVRIEAIASRLLKSITVPFKYVAVGRAARTLDEFSYSRRDVDRSVRVRRIVGTGADVMFPEDVTLDAVLLAGEDYLEAQGIQPTAGVVGSLLAYDQENDACLLDSLEAYLAALGDVTSAAARLHVHPNTMRYRLRRVAEIGGLDLRDPDAVLLAWLGIRRLRLRSEPT